MPNITLPPYLWHYTCQHTRNQLGPHALLKPHPQPLLRGLPLIWLTDLYPARREHLGLSMSLVKCDRMAVVYRVDVAAHPSAINPWRDVIKLVPTHVSLRFNLAEGALPMHWWVGTKPLHAEVVT